jgi:beta-xylosidase
VLRAKNIYGPYDEKIVLAQGSTPINGPHQGAWVTTQTGEDWFLHFQDKGAYGRILHLQPMTWKNDFPVIGADTDGDGTGNPVASFKKPNVGKEYPVQTPPDSDEFDGPVLGPQWQWQANFQENWAFPFPAKGVLRMNSVQLPDNFKNLWQLPNLLLQKFPAEEFTATAKVTISPRFDGEKFGLVIMGIDYSYVGVTYKTGKLYIAQAGAKDADKGYAETENVPYQLNEKTFFLRVKVSRGAMCSFSFSTDEKTYTSLGVPFKAREGRWIGAKVGFFYTRPGKFNDAGTADIDWFRFE